MLQDILPRLSKVRGRNGGYSACCPAHDDRSPSLTLRETADGKVLLHCFAGCSVQQVAEALGLELSDLFPPTYDRDKPVARVRFAAQDLLRVIQHEATVVAIAAYDLAKNRPLSEGDRERLLVAVDRINEALEHA